MQVPRFMSQGVGAIGLAATLGLTGCTDPADTPVGDLQTFSQRETRAFERLPAADADLLRKVQRLQRALGPSAADRMTGTDATWLDLNAMTLGQALEVARRWAAGQDALSRRVQARIDADEAQARRPRRGAPGDEREAPVEAIDGRRLAHAADAEPAEAGDFRPTGQTLIERVEARGGHCRAVGGHLRAQLQHAERSGDWSGFRQTLDRGASYGC